MLLASIEASQVQDPTNENSDVKKSKILALDCSTDQISLSLCGQNRSAPGASKASQSLLPEIQALLRQQNLAVSDLDAIAYGQGPGAFTGLRTALAVAQGLAFVANIPMVGVSGLQAIAFTAHARTQARYILAALDARMGEVYCAEFDWQEQVDSQYQQTVEARLLPADGLQVPQDFLLSGNVVDAEERPQAAAIAEIAQVLFQTGCGVPAELASLHYVRNKVALTTQERAVCK